MTNAKNIKSSDGFTIVELMISLSVLSVILVVSTVTITQIGKLFTKGVNAASLQSTNRTIIADITSATQFSGSAVFPCTATPTTCYGGKSATADPVYGSTYAFCIGATRYSYLLGHGLGTDDSSNITTQHVLWRDTQSNSGSCDPVDLTQTTPSANGYEMLGPHMSLTRFYISETPANSGVYKTDVWMAYGDQDLLDVDINGLATCKAGSGSQFCVPSQLTSSVVRRIQ